MRGPALSWSTIHVSGDDAEVYLDGQLSQSLDAARHGAWTLLLDPSGVVVTSAWWRIGNDGHELLVPAELVEVAAARLRRFMLRVKCTIDVVEGATQPPLEFENERLMARWPWSAEYAASLGPHSFGRPFVDATVSFTKGCFTGQELVGRMDARGASMPWRLVFARGPSVERIDEVLRSSGPDGPQGVTSSATDHLGLVALGFAHRTLLEIREFTDVSVEAVA